MICKLKIEGRFDYRMSFNN